MDNNTLYNHEVEQIVLGGIILDREAMSQVIKILDIQCFFTEVHQDIWNAALAVFDDGADVDVLTMTRKLKSQRKYNEVGGATYLSQLSNKLSSSSNIRAYAKELVEYKIRRIVNKVGIEAVGRSKDDGQDPYELMDELNSMLDEAVNVTSEESKTTGERIGEVIKRIEYAQTVDGITGVPSFITELDETTGGWQSPDLIIVAGRPGMGKTAMAITTATEEVKAGSHIAFFSIEMTSIQLTMRRLTQETGTSYMNFLQGKNIPPNVMSEIVRLRDEWAEDGFHISEETTLRGIIAKSRYLKKKYDIKVIYIDYIQLIIHHLKGHGNREQELSFISRSLKSLAKELNIPVIALCQLNRSVEARGGEKKPLLSDLRESGAIEQDADLIIFTYRPEYYGIYEDSEGESNIGIGWLLISKHRNGAVGDVKCKWEGVKMKWSDFVPNPYSSQLWI